MNEKLELATDLLVKTVSDFNAVKSNYTDVMESFASLMKLLLDSSWSLPTHLQIGLTLHIQSTLRTMDRYMLNEQSMMRSTLDCLGAISNAIRGTEEDN